MQDVGDEGVESAPQQYFVQNTATSFNLLVIDRISASESFVQVWLSFLDTYLFCEFFKIIKIKAYRALIVISLMRKYMKFSRIIYSLPILLSSLNLNNNID